MENSLKVADQIYKFVFARHRVIAEVVTVAIFFVLLHVSLNFLAGRSALPVDKDHNPSNTTTGDQSPIINNPTAPVTINQENRQ